MEWPEKVMCAMNLYKIVTWGNPISSYELAPWLVIRKDNFYHFALPPLYFLIPSSLLISLPSHLSSSLLISLPFHLPLFSLAALNVLVFNNGRVVKLADFGSAIHVEDIPTMGAAKLKGCTPFFAAPEVHT